MEQIIKVGTEGKGLSIPQNSSESENLFIDEPANLGRRIKLCRQHLGLTQAELASPEHGASYISSLEQGKIRPSLKGLQLVAKRLDKPVGYLLYGISYSRYPSDVDMDPAFELEKARFLVEKAEISTGDLRETLCQEAEEILSKISTVAIGENDQALIGLTRGRIKLLRGDFGGARNEYEKGFDLAARNGCLTLKIELICRLGDLEFALGYLDLAVTYFRKALTECESNPELVSVTIWLEVLSGLTKVYIALGQKNEAILVYGQVECWLENITSLEKKIDYNRRLVTAFNNLPDQVNAAYYSSLRVVDLQELRWKKLRLVLQVTIGNELAKNNRTSQAKQLLEMIRMADQSSQTLAATLKALFYTNLAELRLKEGQLKEAYDLAGQALTFSQPDETLEIVGKATLVKARVEEAEGQLLRADESYKAAIKYLEQNGDCRLQAAACKAYAQALEKWGRIDLAFHYLRKACLLNFINHRY